MGGALVAARGLWIPPGPLIRQGGGNPGGAPDRHACAGGLLFERHIQLASNDNSAINDLPKLLRLSQFLLLFASPNELPMAIP
jgi:hypothetical protein